MKKSVVLFLAALFVFSVSFGQKSQKELKSEVKEKASKNARKEQKKLEKDGWRTDPGSLPMDKLLDAAWEKQLQTDDQGQPLYMYADGNAVASDKTAGNMQAIETAKLALAGQVSTNIASLVSANIGNTQLSTQSGESVTEVVQSAKNVIAQKMGKVEPFFKLYRSSDTYKNLEKGKIEVQVRLFYNSSQALNTAKEEVKKVLKDKLNANEEDLKKLMGM